MSNRVDSWVNTLKDTMIRFKERIDREGVRPRPIGGFMISQNHHDIEESKERGYLEHFCTLEGYASLSQAREFFKSYYATSKYVISELMGVDEVPINEEEFIEVVEKFIKTDEFNLLKWEPIFFFTYGDENNGPHSFLEIKRGRIVV